jgi:ABC-type lipoprotein release transport system permease subunit
MYKIILTIRFLLKRRISYFAVAATGLCVFVAFVVITVLSGLTADFKGYIHQYFGDCVVSTRSLVGFGYYDEFIEILEQAQVVQAVSPVIRGYAQVTAVGDSEQVNIRSRRAATFVGVDPVAHSRVTALGQWLCLHQNDIENTFEPAYDTNLPGIVPGMGFLFEYGSQGEFNVTKELPHVAFEVSVFPLTAKGAPAKAGLGEVSTKTFYCSDYTHTDHRPDWDGVCLPFDHAQRLCGMEGQPKRVNAIYIKFKDGVSLGPGCEKIAELWRRFVKDKADVRGANLLKKVRVQSWKTHNRALVAMAETQQTFMIVIFGLVGIITVFVVFAVFYMIVSHKSKDIGILKSVGVSNANVLGLFLSFGLLVGIAGSVMGALGGWQFLVHIEQIHESMFELFELRLSVLAKSDMKDIPNQMNLKVLAAVVLSTISACWVGAVIPSWQAARLKPVETLQVTQL